MKYIKFILISLFILGLVLLIAGIFLIFVSTASASVWLHQYNAETVGTPYISADQHFFSISQTLGEISGIISQVKIKADIQDPESINTTMLIYCYEDSTYDTTCGQPSSSTNDVLITNTSDILTYNFDDYVATAGHYYALYIWNYVTSPSHITDINVYGADIIFDNYTEGVFDIGAFWDENPSTEISDIYFRIFGIGESINFSSPFGINSAFNVLSQPNVLEGEGYVNTARYWSGSYTYDNTSTTYSYIEVDLNYTNQSGATSSYDVFIPLDQDINNGTFDFINSYLSLGSYTYRARFTNFSTSSVWYYKNNDTEEYWYYALTENVLPPIINPYDIGTTTTTTLDSFGLQLRNRIGTKIPFVYFYLFSDKANEYFNNDLGTGQFTSLSMTIPTSSAFTNATTISVFSGTYLQSLAPTGVWNMIKSIINAILWFSLFMYLAFSLNRLMSLPDSQ